jgi:hypothetical protein
MSDKKYTLDDIFGNNDEEKLIDIQLLEGDIENLLLQLINYEQSGTLIDREDYYRYMRAVCLIDISLHKQGTNNCEVGSSACGLLSTLEAFIKKFKDEIEHDKNYKLSDFQWK